MDAPDTASPSHGGASEGAVESGHGAPKPEKDPRKVAWRYQLELCKKALEENIIVYLGTGYGKTHIAVLHMYELRPQWLLFNSKSYIEDSLDFKVGTYCGSSKQLKNHQDWEKEIEQYESEAGKKLPFVLVINLQVPAKPNYSLVLYYGADRPAKPDSLFSKFVDGDDIFRNARFKLIPSIVEGYWMVKRAVGTKACLLGKAVTCKYLRQDNFVEIDVDIGSSSVARSVIGLVLGYVTNIVVDLAILIEAREEEELPEYILGTVRLNRVRLDSSVHLEV